MAADPARLLRAIGPGLVLAAAGIGAGDVVVASVTGIRTGTTLLWGIAFTVALKFVLTEALARWQLATGETIVRAWVTRLPRWVSLVFGAYLLLWTFLVGASLSSACGLAAASLVPALPVPVWGAIHALIAGALVALGRHRAVQRVTKVLIGLMALCVLVSAALSRPPLPEVMTGLLVPRLPAVGGAAAFLALLGGIGGSLTVLCYSYLMRDEGWSGAEKLRTVRGDLRLAYVFTGVFGVALTIIAAGVTAEGAAGARIALEIAAHLGTLAGPVGRWVFLIGFWCTVFTAMLGVWQGVPPVFVDLVGGWRERADRPPDARAADPRRDRVVYLASLAFLAGPPLALLWLGQPVAVVVTFSIAGAFFMPFLAGTLLYLGNQRAWMGELRNRALGNAALVVCLVVFGAVCAREIGLAIGGP